MIRLTELKLPLDHDPADLDALVLKTLSLAPGDLTQVLIFKRSVDARKAALVLVYIVDVVLAREELERLTLSRCSADPHVLPTPDMGYHPVGAAPCGESTRAKLRPVVVGFGPCGIFAALLLAQMGFKPIVLERGKTVRERTKDTWGLWRKGVLHPESNVQFGEGGAGTFSDGKLWSQIKDPRFLGRKVMREFVLAGAPEDILVEAHPHIGTFKLVKVVENMRAQIVALGGEIRFEQRVTQTCNWTTRWSTNRVRRVVSVHLPCLMSPLAFRMNCVPTTWCWRWGIVPVTALRCCTARELRWLPSHFRSGFALSIRKA